MRIFSCLLTFLFFATNCHAQEKKFTKDEIIDKYLKNGAWQYGLFSREWQQKIDEGIKLDSTIAYLWQQKAMPLFKQMRYQEGMPYLDKAVKLDPNEWLSYRAFMKCIFSKDYKGAIKDFDQCKKDYPNRYVMDHSYDFYQAVSYMQLGQFEKAERILESEVSREKSEGGAHYMTLFYFGVAKYKQGKWSEANAQFSEAIKIYSHFSDAKYYQASATEKLGNVEEAKRIFEEAKADFKAGYTINEDNAIYERYPYQVNWKLVH